MLVRLASFAEAARASSRRTPELPGSLTIGSGGPSSFKRASVQ
jgi:hypothetical protein